MKPYWEGWIPESSNWWPSSGKGWLAEKQRVKRWCSLWSCQGLPFRGPIVEGAGGRWTISAKIQTAVLFILSWSLSNQLFYFTYRWSKVWVEAKHQYQLRLRHHPAQVIRRYLMWFPTCDSTLNFDVLPKCVNSYTFSRNNGTEGGLFAPTLPCVAAWSQGSWA